MSISRNWHWNNDFNNEKLKSPDATWVILKCNPSKGIKLLPSGPVYYQVDADSGLLQLSNKKSTLYDNDVINALELFTSWGSLNYVSPNIKKDEFGKALIDSLYLISPTAKIIFHPFFLCMVSPPSNKQRMAVLTIC